MIIETKSKKRRLLLALRAARRPSDPDRRLDGTALHIASAS
jgi:hypothetical protein